jgi:tetratricopeptide (TPR) repeat protein
MTIAALILPLALLQAEAPAPSAADQEAGARFEHCVAQIERTPERAYEEGMAWASEGHSLQGYRCAAMALIGEHRYDEGARRLQSLATATSPDLTALRAALLSQAGNAWLLAHNPSQARSAFTMAITTLQADPSQQPDLLIDRARAYAMEHDYRHAEEDLSHSLDIRPNDALALQLRAETRLRQSSFDLAESDINAAIALDPRNVEFYKTRGDIIESRRTGTVVDEQ